MNPSEIMRGFRDDPNDYTTCCPKCRYRFAPVLKAASLVSSVEVPFLCPAQTKVQLTADKAEIAFVDFRQHYAGVYRSAMMHFGSLTAAFKLNGIRYLLEPKVEKWQQKVTRFLGRLSDAAIARAANVSVKAVRKLRRAEGIHRAA